MKNIWPTKTLGDLCQLISGQHIDAKDYNTERRGVGYLTGPSDFGPLSPVISKWTEHPKVKAKRGDVLITVKGSGVGKINLLDQDEAAISRQLMAVRVTGAAPKFVHAILSSTFDHFQSLSTGAAIPGISREQVLGLKIALPPLPEQQRIVRILGEAFNGIATAKANAEKNLQNACALFSSGFAGLSSPTEWAGWKRVTVAEIAAPNKGSIRTGPFGSQLLHGEFVDEGVAVLGIDNAVANEFRWGKRRFITQRKYRQLERYRVYAGDVLITIMGTCGRCAIVPEAIPIAINTKHLCCITLDRSKCLPAYLHGYFLYHPIAQEFLVKRAKGAIMAGLNMGIIQELPVLLPPIERQKALIRALNSLHAETNRLAHLYEQKLAALEELKKSLLHQAFSGAL